MNASPLLLVALSAGLGVLTVNRAARALGPADIEIAGRVGGGTSPVAGGPGINPLGFGVGARGGVSFDNFYGGVSFMYYFGGGQDVPGPLGAAVHDSATSVLYGIELGYDIGLPIVTLRPQLGIGKYTLNADGSATVFGLSFSGSSTWDNAYLEPGITVKASFGPILVAADANLFWLPGAGDVQVSLSQYAQYTLSSQLAFTGHVQAGVEF